MTAPRNTTTRDQHRAVIRRDRPPCSLCGGPIDYQLKYPHPLSFTVDHVIPLSRGGEDSIENKAAAHRACNQHKYNKFPVQATPPDEPRTYVTHRTW